MVNENNISIGRGTLKQFKQDYDAINSQLGQVVTASQLFPAGHNVSDLQMPNAIIFEYVIYYKKNPNAALQINKESGAVEVKPKINLS
jgi:hypothetical protein